MSAKNLRTCSQGHQYYKSSDCPTCPFCEAERKPGNNFMAELSTPARRALESAGATTLQKLSQYTKKQILALHSMGRASIPKLRKALADAGLKFKV